jgi:hypothetical protein
LLAELYKLHPIGLKSPIIRHPLVLDPIAGPQRLDLRHRHGSGVHEHIGGAVVRRDEAVLKGRCRISPCRAPYVRPVLGLCRCRFQPTLNF